MVKPAAELGRWGRYIVVNDADPALTLDQQGSGKILSWESSSVETGYIDNAGNLVVTGGGVSLDLGDDDSLAWGAGDDFVVHHTSAGVAADTALTTPGNVLVGTPVTPATAANSLIISTVTDGADILMATRRGADSEAFLFQDASAGVLYLTPVQGGLTIGLAADAPAPDIADNVLIWSGSSGGTTGSSTLLALESAGNTILQLLSPNSNDQQIKFGDPEQAGAGAILYSHANTYMRFVVETVNQAHWSDGALAFQKAMTVSTASGNLTFSAATDADIFLGDDNNLVRIDGGANNASGAVGIGNVGSVPSYVFHVTAPTGSNLHTVGWTNVSGNSVIISNTAQLRLYDNASASSPNVVFGSDTDTGLAHGAADQLSLVAGGVEMIRLIEGASDYLRINVPMEGAGTTGEPRINFDTTDGSQADALFTFTGDENTGVFRKAADQLGLAFGGDEIVVRDLAGAPGLYSPDGALAIEAGSSSLQFRAGTALQWSISSGGVLDANGSKTLRAGTCTLSIDGNISGGGEVVINDGSYDNNTRVEGANNANLIVVDAGEDSIGFGTTPADGAFFHLLAGAQTRTANSGTGNVINVSSDTNNFDNASSTVAIYAAVNLGVQTLTGNTATLTFTDGATLRIGGPPVASTNVAFTNEALALWVDSGLVQIDDALVVGSPTGGDQGAGTINAVAVYDDGVILSDHVFEDTYDLLPIREMVSYYERERHLPTIGGRGEWDAGGRPSVGRLSTQIWETVEVQARYIGELEQRVADLERIAA